MLIYFSKGTPLEDYISKFDKVMYEESSAFGRTKRSVGNMNNEVFLSFTSLGRLLYAFSLHA